MITGGGAVIDAMRPDVVRGVFIAAVVGPWTPGMEGGAWIDAPDYFAAGSTRRVEEWRGRECTARADLTVARR